MNPSIFRSTPMNVVAHDGSCCMDNLSPRVPPTSPIVFNDSSIVLVQRTAEQQLQMIEKIDVSIPPIVEIGRGGQQQQQQQQQQQHSTLDEHTCCTAGDDISKNKKPCEWVEQGKYTRSSDGSSSISNFHCPRIGDSSSSHHALMWTALCYVPPVPQYAPLERTVLRVNGPPLEAVICRIAHFMKMNSICCVYHGTEARVDCLTCRGLKFVVQLWKATSSSDDPIISSTKKNNNDSVVLIECQRRRGCCVAMRDVRRQLYRAVMALSGPHHVGSNGIKLFGRQRWKSSSNDYSLARRVQTVSKQLSARLLGRPVHDEEKNIKMDGPNIHLPNGFCLLELLEGEKTDDNKLGMEMLLFALTKPDRVGGYVSEGVARGLAFGEAPHGIRLRAGYMKFFCPPSLLSRQLTNGVDCSESQDVSALDGTPPGGNCDLQEMLLVSLKVMRSCLDRIIEVERDYLSNEAMMLNLSSDFWMDALTIFVVHLEDCSSRPQEAALSTGCIYKLETLQPFLLMPRRKLWTVETVLPLLRAAHSYGVRHHLLLEQESRILIEYIERTQAMGEHHEVLL